MISLGLAPSSVAIMGFSRSVQFDPAALFSASEPGVWLDPSDLTTLFQDAAGATPVTAAGQSVGLVLDKSKGLVLGPEIITDGGFNNAENWSTGSGWSVSGGVAVATAAPSGQTVFQLQTEFVVGKSYLFTYTVVSVTAGGFAAMIESQTGSFRTAPGTYSEVFVYTGLTPNVRIRAVGTTTGTIDNISVRELPGNHATQSASSGFRPAYQTTPKRLNFDGSDDRLNFAYNPTASGSLAVRINGATASRVAIGSQGATDGRCFLALASDGSLGAGIGAQSTATIKGSTDIRGTWTTGVVTWDGTTVRLYQNGTEVYSGAQSGAVNTTVPMDLGCLNNNGTRAAFWSGGIGAAIALGRVMTPTEVSSLHQLWSNIA